MSLAEFVVELKKLLDKGFIREDGNAIRLSKDGQKFCPITAVCKEKTGKSFSTLEWNKASELIGLSGYNARRVVDSADHSTYRQGYNKNLREKMEEIK